MQHWRSTEWVGGGVGGNAAEAEEAWWHLAGCSTRLMLWLHSAPRPRTCTLPDCIRSAACSDSALILLLSCCRVLSACSASASTRRSRAGAPLATKLCAWPAATRSKVGGTPGISSCQAVWLALLWPAHRLLCNPFSNGWSRPGSGTWLSSRGGLMQWGGTSCGRRPRGIATSTGHRTPRRASGTW